MTKTECIFTSLQLIWVYKSDFRFTFNCIAIGVKQDYYERAQLTKPIRFFVKQDSYEREEPLRSIVFCYLLTLSGQLYK